MTDDQINGRRDAAVANAAGAVLYEICRDDEVAMVCAAFMRIASFQSREHFLVSDWVPGREGKLFATELETFDLWIDDPQYQEPPPLRVISGFIPATEDLV
jgi:hypothetical protein